MFIRVAHFFRSGLCSKLEDEIVDKVGDAKLESEGQADKVEGKIQNAIGGLRDKLKGK